MKQQVDVGSITSAGDRDVPVKKPKKSVGFQIADVVELAPLEVEKTESHE